MQRIPASFVIVKIQVQGSKYKTYSRHIGMGAGCKQHTGAIKNQINNHIPLFSQTALNKSDHFC